MATSIIDRGPTVVSPRRVRMTLWLCLAATVIAPALSIVITAPSQTPLPFWIGLMGVCPLALVIPWAFSLSAGMWTSPTRRWRTAALLLSALAVTWSISVTLLMVAREPYCPDYIDAAAEDGMCDGAMTTATATLFTGTAGVVALVGLAVAAVAAAWWVRELRRHESSLDAEASPR